MNCYNGFTKLEWYADYLLVQEVLNGNIKIWNELYQKTYPLVYHYVKRIHKRWLISYDEIDDAASEAFERCYLKLSSYMGRSKFSTWVCGFCRYVLLNYYHKYRLQYKSITEIGDVFQLSYAYRNPEEYVIKKERDLCIWTAYNSLTFKHKKLLSYYIINEKENNIKLKSDSKGRMDELSEALHIMRNRFLALYDKNNNYN